jgi:hypothetical protein
MKAKPVVKYNNFTFVPDVIHDVERATVIEKYCDNCVKSVFAREEVLYYLSIYKVNERSV